MREALAAALGEDSELELVACAGSMAELSELLEAVAAKVVLLDYGLVAGRLAAAVRELIERHPGIGIVVTAMDSRELLAPLALGAGAAELLLKDSAPVELLAAVHRAGRPRDAVSSASV